MAETPPPAQTLRVGDWVLVHRIPYIDTIALPQWVEISQIDLLDEFESYKAAFALSGAAYDGYWFGPADITPEAKITDQQWAELAKLRLTGGINA